MSILKKLRLPTASNENFLRYAAVACVLSFIFGSYLVRITSAPEKNYLNQLQKKGWSLTLQMYDQALEHGLLSPAERQKLLNLADQYQEKLSESERIRESIGEGEIIGKTGPGGFRAVGKNKDVEALRQMAKVTKSRLDRKRSALGLKYAPLLSKNTGSDLLKQYKHVTEEMRSIKELHGWYYFNWLGILVKTIHALAVVLTFALIPISFLTGINAIFSFFE